MHVVSISFNKYAENEVVLMRGYWIVGCQYPKVAYFGGYY